MDLIENWKDHDPSPIEFMHGRLLDEFHKYRRSQTDGLFVKMSGNEFNKILVAAKLATYEKYKKLELNKPVLKSELK